MAQRTTRGLFRGDQQGSGAGLGVTQRAVPRVRGLRAGAPHTAPHAGPGAAPLRSGAAPAGGARKRGRAVGGRGAGRGRAKWRRVSSALVPRGAAASGCSSRAPPSSSLSAPRWALRPASPRRGEGEGGGGGPCRGVRAAAPLPPPRPVPPRSGRRRGCPRLRLSRAAGCEVSGGGGRGAGGAGRPGPGARRRAPAENFSVSSPSAGRSPQPRRQSAPTALPPSRPAPAARRRWARGQRRSPLAVRRGRVGPEFCPRFQPEKGGSGAHVWREGRAFIAVWRLVFAGQGVLVAASAVPGAAAGCLLTPRDLFYS